MAKFKRSAVVKLLEALDYKAAGKWTVDKLTEKVKGLPKMVDDDTEVEGEENTKLLKALVKAADGEFTIEDDVAEADKAEKPAEADKAEKPAKADKAEKPAKAAAKKAPPKPGKKGPGVCATIIEEFKKGTKEKPVTKEQVLKVLVKKFPDRPEKGMKSTVSAAPSWMVTEKGLKVYSNDEGWWVK